MNSIEKEVRNRLQGRAKEEKRPFQELLQYYGLERFLYRLSRSQHRDQFVLKGALVFRVWDTPTTRPTRDIDFLAFTPNETQILEDIFSTICDIDGDEDGVSFNSKTIKSEIIKEDADYKGLRIKFTGNLGRSRIPMQIDIAFDDVMHPSDTLAEYPTLFGVPSPRLRTYPKESVIAEKFQAMVHLGMINSRMKDFYDLWVLSKRFDFKGAVLAEAISETFLHRETKIEPAPTAFQPDFYRAPDKLKQWTAFLRKSDLNQSLNFESVIETIQSFLIPITKALDEGLPFDHEWRAPGPWRAKVTPKISP